MHDLIAGSPRGGQAGRVSPLVIVAIPVCNEVDYISACLKALDCQVGAAPDRVVLLLNGCTDGTEACVRALAPSLSISVQVVVRELRGRQANAGFARSLAMRYATEGLSEHDVLMTTDADSEVAPDWVAGNLAALRQGADAVCGRAILNPRDAAHIPANLREDDARECRLATLLDEMAALLDPDPSDPWPRHAEDSGASIATTMAAWRRGGGMPAVATGEDRAFIARLRHIDARVRHAPEVFVTVSGRTEGRAQGGMAETIRRRIIQQDEFTDPLIEPAHDRYRRISLRAVARAAHAGARAERDALIETLGVPSRIGRAAFAAPFFGQAWAMLERASSVLQSTRVRFVELAAEIEIAEALVAKARACAVRPVGEIELVRA